MTLNSQMLFIIKFVEQVAEMIAVLGRTEISVEELLDLKLGDVITLDTKIDGDIDLNVGGARSLNANQGLLKISVVLL
ncbi:FliM/FliN family flagellar motor C-terminal domain-containing protein [Paraclostridium bifermentans]|nr:FliM/FliN family flagellar motor C-terminal domain-containing protein [Paraclostridium bifermentans]